MCVFFIFHLGKLLMRMSSHLLELLVGVLLTLNQGWTSTIQPTDYSPHDYTFEAEISIGESGTLISPGFPICCARSWTSYHKIHYTGERKIHGIALLFDDLDLPPDSILKIHDADNKVYASPLPHYTRYSWTRPFILLEATSLVLIVKFGSVGLSQYVGYKATYWIETAEPTVDVPYTDCPLIGDPMDGGTVTVDVVSKPWTKAHYLLDCVWQLKPPVSEEGLFLFLRLGNIDFADGGNLIIRNGIDSESGAQLLQYDHNPANSPNTWNQTEREFSQLSGFYVRLKGKELNLGTFEFSYGVYVDVGVSVKGSTDCNYGLEYSIMTGYHCLHGSTWCIPEEHVCDGIRNCPHGDDEEEVFCLNRARIKVYNFTSRFIQCDKQCADGTCVPDWYICDDAIDCRPPMKFCGNGECVYPKERCSAACVPPRKECPDGLCIDPDIQRCSGQCNELEILCDNGVCANRWDFCPEVCEDSDRGKLCQDGRCIPKYAKCHEEQCPSYKPERCNNGDCYWASQRCDIKNDCVDGSDELDCEGYCRGKNYYACDNGWCYPHYHRCNGYEFCSDGSDEAGCSNTWSRINIAFLSTSIILILAAIIGCALHRIDKSTVKSASVDNDSGFTVSPEPATDYITDRQTLLESNEAAKANCPDPPPRWSPAVDPLHWSPPMEHRLLSAGIPMTALSYDEDAVNEYAPLSGGCTEPATLPYDEAILLMSNPAPKSPMSHRGPSTRTLDQQSTMTLDDQSISTFDQLDQQSTTSV